MESHLTRVHQPKTAGYVSKEELAAEVGRYPETKASSSVGSYTIVGPVSP